MPCAKYTSENMVLRWDFKNEDELALYGETIASIVSIAFTPADGTIVLNTGGPAVIVGSQVLAWLSGGSSGQSYTGTCKVLTSAGKTLTSKMPLIMLD